MKKKSSILMLSMTATSILLSACGNQPSTTTNTTTETAVATTTAATTEETTVAAEASTTAATEDASVELVNPMIEYQNIAELNNTMNFMMIDFPVSYGMLDTEKFYAIDGVIAEIQCTDDNKNPVHIRMSERKDDISGVNGVTYSQTKIGDTNVNIGKLDKLQVAWWQNDHYSYSLSVDGLSDADFSTYLELLISDSLFNLEYSSIENYTSVADLNSALGYSAMELPATYKVSPTTIQMSSEKKAYIRYNLGKESDDCYVDLYTAPVATPLSDLYSYSFQDAEIDGMKVKECKDDSLHIVTWADSDLNYMLVSLNLSDPEFSALLKEIKNK
ncbi:MAG: hypothetical protein RRX92_08260 [Lachnospiraceae bacterium]